MTEFLFTKLETEVTLHEERPDDKTDSNDSVRVACTLMGIQNY